MGEKTYRVFVENPQEFLAKHGQVTIQVLEDDMGEHFNAKIMTSATPQESMDKLLVQGKGPASQTNRECYVKVMERIEEEAYIPTFFRPGRMGLDRQGLKHALEERKRRDAEKKKTMTTDLEERRKRRQEITEDLLKKPEEKK